MRISTWSIVSRIAAFLLVFALLGGVYLVITGPLFKIHHVYVQASDIVKLDTKFLNDEQNLLFLDEAKIVRELKRQSPLIKNVKLTKKYPDNLEVELTFREPVATIEKVDKVFLLDSEGMILPAELNLNHKPLPRVTCAVRVPSVGQILTQPDVLHGLQLISQFSVIEIELAELKCDKNQSELVTNVTRIIFLPETNVHQLTDSLQFLFKQFRIEGTYPKVVDLRFSKPVLIREEWQNATGSGESSSSSEINIPAP